MIDQPISRKAIHDGGSGEAFPAPVAPQQSRILRVDEISVTNSKSAEMFSAGYPQPSQGKRMCHLTNNGALHICAMN